LAVIVTVGSFFLYHWSIKHSSAIMASLTNYLQPVFTVVLANLILREQITFGFIVGSTLVFCGLLITTGTRIITGVQKLIKR
jgi:drug/metabolite transporter (DMT)-like permease